MPSKSVGINWPRMIEIYHVTAKGNVTSSNVYYGKDFRDIFGDVGARKLMNGQKVKGKGSSYYVKASAFK